MDWDEVDETCGGSMVLHCYCGGDFCVCDFGEQTCPGCEDCRPDDLDDDDEDDQGDDQ